MVPFEGKKIMEAVTFSALPTEIHVIIAKECENNDLINLCLTSKQMNERCLHVLYRHVTLPFDRHGLDGMRGRQCSDRARVQLKRQKQFFRTLLSHPEYGKDVRFLKGKFCISSFDTGNKTISSDDEVWRAMQSLTHVQEVDIASNDDYFKRMKQECDHRAMAPRKQVPQGLFQSATSVRLVGLMQYGLAKSILNAINPATLKHLCLDMVQEWDISNPFNRSKPRGRNEGHRIGCTAEDGQARGAMSGLLTTLTGRCTALQTLILRRVGESEDGFNGWWDTAAEEASYVEWSSFIRSVQGTVEKFTFEQAVQTLRLRVRQSRNADNEVLPYGIMDERFRRFILPVIASGNWPCLTFMELRGVKPSNGQGRGLRRELETVIGRNVDILVEKVQIFEHPLFLWM